MATNTIVKNVCQLRLNNGTDSQGNVKTVGINLGQLSPTGWDDDKALAIADKLEDCLTKTIVETYHITTASLRA